MKNTGIILALVFCVAQVAGAASVGAPGTQPKQGRYLIGIEYNTLKARTVFDQTVMVLEPVLIDASGNRYIGKFTYGLTDRLAVVVKGGTADLKLWDTGSSVSYDHSSGTAGGIGLRGVFYEDLSLGLSVDASGQYFIASPADDTYYKRSAKWNEWDVALCLSIMNEFVDTTSLIEPFTLSATGFHVGMRYSDAEVEWKTQTTSGKWGAKDDTGFFAGFDLYFNDNYVFSVEARVSDEKAYTAAFSFSL